MRTHIHRAARLALGVATLGGVGVLGTLSAGSASAAAVTATTSLSSSPLFGHGDNPVVGHVYLDDNTVGTNTISAFDRRADGSLTPLARLSLRGRRRGHWLRPGIAGRDPDQ